MDFTVVCASDSTQPTDAAARSLTAADLALAGGREGHTHDKPVVYNLDVVSDSVYTHISRLAVRSRVLVVAGSMSGQCLRRIFRAGARGFILRDSPIRQFVHALNEVFRGRMYLDPGLTAVALGSVETDAALMGLTEREHDVLRLLAKGFTNRETAAALMISARTVETHRANLRRKLGVQCRSELILKAEERGWLSEMQN